VPFLLAEEGMGSLVILLLAERAPSEGPRSTRAVKGNLATPFIGGGQRKGKADDLLGSRNARSQRTLGRADGTSREIDCKAIGG
jgi:hypothetical protein